LPEPIIAHFTRSGATLSHQTLTPTDPRPSHSATYPDPVSAGTAPTKDPGMITCPAFKPSPRGASVLASQATAFAGLPSTAAPVALLISTLS